MQRIAVATQRADGEAVVVERLLEFVERGVLLEQRELAVRIAGIVAGAEFNRGDAESFQFRDHVREGELR